MPPNHADQSFAPLPRPALGFACDLRGRGLIVLEPQGSAAAFRAEDTAEIRLLCHDRAGQGLPLRLSLRLAAGRLVLNDRRVSGEWGVPLNWPLRLPEGGLRRIALSFGSGGALRLRLNGQTVLRLAAGRFDLRGIGWVSAECHGPEARALPPPMLRLWPRGAETAPGVPRLRHEPPCWILAEGLTPALTRLPGRFEFRSLDGGSLEGGARLAVLAGQVFVPDAGQGGGQGLSLIQRIPAALWQASPAGLRIGLVAGGRAVLAPVELTRAEACAAIARQVAGPAAAPIGPETIELAAVLAPDLPPAVLAACRAAAAARQLPDLLPPPAAEPPAAPPPAAAADDPAALTDRLVRAYARARRAAPQADALRLLQDLVRDAPRPLPAGLVLMLAEEFCHLGQIAGLARLAQDGAVALPPPAAGNDWQASASLPFLWLAGDRAGVIGALHHLAASQRQGWLATSALAWLMRQAAGVAGPDAAPDAEVIGAGLAAIRHHAADPWGRGPCRALVALFHDLLAAAAGWPPALACALADCARQVQGLSPAFWQGLGPLTGLPAAAMAGMQETRAAFAALEAALAAPHPPAAALRAALDRLAAAGVQGSAALRRNCLPLLPAPDLTADLAGLADPEEALCRHAAPGAAPVPVADRPALRAAIAARLDPQPPAAAGPLRAACLLARQALGLATLAEAEDPAGDPIDRLAEALPGLSWRGAGLALGLATLAGLAETPGPQPAAARLARALIPLARAVQEGGADRPAGLDRLTARLRQCQTRTSPDLTALLRLLPDPGPAAPPGPAAAALRPGASALFDTLVMVRSCARHLPDRLPRLRAQWLNRLKSMGIPHVLAIGSDRTALERQILHLPVGDGPEHLPQKTLAMLGWAAETGFAHVWLVEDDTLLDPEAVFGGFGWRLVDYYGRWQGPGPGFRTAGMAGGNPAVDLSPAEGGHADAGLGYALSQRALQAIRQGLRGAAGQKLVLGSHRADKLVGDLLAMAGIGPMAPDHGGALLRPARPGGLAVINAMQGFVPSAASGARAAHPAPETLPDPGALHPPRLWPATAPLRVGPAGRALVLAAGAGRLEQARRAPVAVVTVLRNERILLPHFLSHYRRLGAGAFLIADNGSDDGSAEYLAAQPDVVLFSAAAPFREAMQGTEWKIALMAQLRPNRWSLVADTDELLVGQGLAGPGHPQGWAGGLSLPDFLAQPQFAGADAFRLLMLDMYPAGPLAAADFTAGDPFALAGLADRQPFRPIWPGRGPYSDRQAVTSALRHRLLPGSRPDQFVAEKVALLRYRPWMRLSVSLHYAAEVRLAAPELIFAHFKYNADFHAKTRREIRRGQYFDNAAEYRRYAEILSEGRDVIADPAVSVPWQQAVAGWLAVC